MHKLARVLSVILLSAMPGTGALGEAAAQGGKDVSDLLRSTQGTWNGVLEYRDYSSGEQVTLPASLNAELAAGGSKVIWDLRMSDPGREVYSLIVASFDRANDEIIAIDCSGKAGATEKLALVDVDRSGPGVWSITAERSGMDNNRPATIRIVQELDGNSMTRSQLVRYTDEGADAQWVWRNSLKLERVTAQPQDLVGTWRVDLRSNPDAPPAFTDFIVTKVGDGALEGTFYGSALANARVQNARGELHFAFTTGDGSGGYNTAGVLRDGVLFGTTNSEGRGFLSVWRATKIEPSGE